VDTEDLVRDNLVVNAPYEGFVAEAYDVWLPPDGTYSDRTIYRRSIELGGGPALELGCGTGRLLLSYVADGFEVEGVDSSADMLSICAGHAERLGLAVTLFHTDWLTLELGKQYATVYNPSGSFALIASDEDARTALAVWREHVRPGGQLVVSMGVPSGPDLDAQYEWRIRRSGTRASDGVTFMVHEAFRYDTDAQVQHVLNRHEIWDVDGSLMHTSIRRHAIRWWTQSQLEAMFRESGCTDVKSLGTETEFIVVGKVPST
jgi:SAM-dependent methyltransferase